MISAFGVEHGVSKAYKKLAPKLMAAQKPNTPDTMGGAMKNNYAHWRAGAGQVGQQHARHAKGLFGGGPEPPLPSQLSRARQLKTHSNAMVTGTKNMRAREGRKLP